MACGSPERPPEASKPASPSSPVEPAGAETPTDDTAVEAYPDRVQYPARARFDIHTHLVDDAIDPLLRALDEAGIQRAVLQSSPHLDFSRQPPMGAPPFSGWRAANDRLLAATAPHRDRLLPFITADPAEVTPAELQTWLDAGACGVKLYMGHHVFHERPLDDPAHEPMFTMLEERRVPVLLHVNTFRFEAELDALLTAHPDLNMVCPHFCGSRTDIDRLERILRTHPSLLVDTSHGPGRPGIDGYANIDRELERLRALIVAEPERFLFGSDLVTTYPGARDSSWRGKWARQLDANLGLVEAAQFEYWRIKTSDPRTPAGPKTWGTYRGLALDGQVLEAVLVGNAERWLGSCGPSPSPS